MNKRLPITPLPTLEDRTKDPVWEEVIQLERYLLTLIMENYVEDNQAYGLERTTALYHQLLTHPKDLDQRMNALITTFEKELRANQPFGTEQALDRLSCARDHLDKRYSESDIARYLRTIDDVKQAEISSQLEHPRPGGCVMVTPVLAAFVSLYSRLSGKPIELRINNRSAQLDELDPYHGKAQSTLH